MSEKRNSKSGKKGEYTSVPFVSLPLFVAGEGKRVARRPFSVSNANVPLSSAWRKWEINWQFPSIGDAASKHSLTDGWILLCGKGGGRWNGEYFCNLLYRYCSMICYVALCWFFVFCCVLMHCVLFLWCEYLVSCSLGVKAKLMLCYSVVLSWITFWTFLVLCYV